MCKATAELLHLKELEVEMLRLRIRKKEMAHEFELRKIKEENQRQICLKELELKQATSVVPPPSHCVPHFDVDKHVKFVPPLGDRAIGDYFVLFEHVAKMLQWPKIVWPLLLKRVLTGKGQEAQASLPTIESLDYEQVKAVMLDAHNVEPEVCGGDIGCLEKSEDDLAGGEVLFNHYAAPIFLNQGPDVVAEHPKVFLIKARKQELVEFEKDFQGLSNSFMAHLEAPDHQPVERQTLIGGHEPKVPDLPLFGFSSFSEIASDEFAVSPQKQFVPQQKNDPSLTSQFLLVSPRNQDGGHNSHRGARLHNWPPLHRRGGGLLFQFPMEEGPFERTAGDCAGPFPCTEGGNQGSLVSTDLSVRLAEAIHSAHAAGAEPLFVRLALKLSQERWLCDDEPENSRPFIYPLGSLLHSRTSLWCGPVVMEHQQDMHVVSKTNSSYQTVLLVNMFSFFFYLQDFAPMFTSYGWRCYVCC